MALFAAPLTRGAKPSIPLAQAVTRLKFLESGAAAMSPANFVLTLSCADRPGIVAAVTTELAALGANIAESNQFWDRETGQFFMRIAFAAPAEIGSPALERAMRPPIERFSMKTALADLG